MLEFAPTSPLMIYDEALLYIWTCTHDNKYDWHFPTLDDIVYCESKSEIRFTIDPWREDITNLDNFIANNGQHNTIPVRPKDA